ncbi:chorion class CB protein PC404-like [Vanessa atalanta]|uniref:chorion class CB protein PC404-like n=1 Tax=Vanessa atalanta TaxID=42275 RepID=UPI001FCE23CD|nr:chorion class CB protein PC404-like [Vanessa atalanta]
MSALAFLFFCFQAYLLQNVCSQYLRGAYGPGLAGTTCGCGAGLAPAAFSAYPEFAAYGGAGVGDVVVAGEMGVAGTTAVAGQVPILGAVEFGGIVPAGGTVSIAGSCGCGCNAAYGPYSAAPFAAAVPFAAAAPFAAAPCTSPFAYEVAAVSASNGGGLEIASGSALPPRGVSVLSENAIEGPLAVAGALPFLGTVGLEGVLPTAGFGAVNYGCGNGAVGIVAEDIAPVGIASPFGYSVGSFAGDRFGYGPFGYGTGLYGRAGYGCGAFI